MSVFIHFTIYSASSAFHVATAMYVSALLLDMMSIMQKCDIFTKNAELQPSNRDVYVKNELKKAIAIHMNILEYANINLLVISNNFIGIPCVFSLTGQLVKIMSGVLFIIIANSVIFVAVCLFQMETVI